MPEAGQRPLSIAWIGHSTVLLEVDGVRLLTDPLLRARIGHLRRVSAPPEDDAADVDAVLVSHVHYDHLDLRSLDRVRTARVVVPVGARRLLDRRGFEDVVELREGEETSIGPVTVVGTHADHDARRFPFGAPTPSLGYLIRGSARVYFAGDTEIFDAMSELAPDLDVALLPIWGWGPRLGPGHLDPRRAAEALRLLRPRVAIPIHWGTYRRLGMSRDPAALREPAEQFARSASELAPDVDVRVLAPGERLEVPPC
jgi:L-ascorbate metabolism protein UlaG (beta-lactamase superfamily)